MAESSDLEQFRQKWREEVGARTKGHHSKPNRQKSRTLEKDYQPSKPEHVRNLPPTRHPLADLKHEEEVEHGDDVSDEPSLIKKIEGLAVDGADDDLFSGSRTSTEPQSALEHYERAVEKESQGNLGDSLSHYRKAYRMDAKVDQSYKNKHFPAKSKPTYINPSNAASTVPNPAHHSSKEPASLLPIQELIQSFSGAPILGSEPVIKGDVPPACPIKDLPHEVLLELLLQTAIIDPASLVRLSLVCKKIAHHVYTENGIWKRIALGPEFGLASQVYSFNTDIQGREMIDRPLDCDEAEPVDHETLFPTDQDWREVFHSYPRIRFTGVYISTVNYTRAGHSAASSTSWNSPIHIITYYRYIRFFRNGTVISLLSTNEPIDVVHHLTPENINLIRTSEKGHSHPLNGASSAPTANLAARDPNASSTAPAPPPSAQNLMRHALRGRWRLCHSTESSSSEVTTNGSLVPGDIHIETEGAGPRYMYTLHFSLRSGTGKKAGVKNNKLVWKGFWSYNSLTDDWSEFQLRNDKAFWFSRVKSYGLAD